MSLYGVNSIFGSITTKLFLLIMFFFIFDCCPKNLLIPRKILLCLSQLVILRIDREIMLRFMLLRVLWQRQMQSSNG